MPGYMGPDLMKGGEEKRCGAQSSSNDYDDVTPEFFLTPDFWICLFPVISKCPKMRVQ
jgi:hypothetical protein